MIHVFHIAYTLHAILFYSYTSLGSYDSVNCGALKSITVTPARGACLFVKVFLREIISNNSEKTQWLT